MLTTTLTAGGPPARYTVEHRGGCILIFGAVPADALGPLARLVPKNAVIDPNVARMAGANFAIGLRDDLEKLRAALAAGAEAREAKKPANKELSPAAVKWLASGERGISSETLFQFTTGVAVLDDSAPCHPWDPSDFRRCLLLLDQCPELRTELDRMRAVSPTWNALVERWAELEALLTEEVGNWRNPPKRASAPKTWELMKSIINSTEA